MITYTTRYNKIGDCDSFTVYHRLDLLKSTAIFWEYFNLIGTNDTLSKIEITKLIKDFIPKSKAKLRITYTENGIEFYKYRKFLFPELYILFK